jgi:simple sugar transport system permease protein
MSTSTATPRTTANSLTPSIGRTVRTREFTVFVAVLLLGAVITAINPAFLSFGNLFDLSRVLIVWTMLAFAALIVLISGGVDISFPAIANVAAYAIMAGFVNYGIDAGPVLSYSLAAVLGVAFGLLNGFLVGRFKVPTLIVTLGTSSLLYGGCLLFIGSNSLFQIPPALTDFSRASIATVDRASGAGTTSLHPVLLLTVALGVIVWLVLSRTALGRKVYALGGNAAVLERSGTNVRRLQLAVYGAAGGLAAIAGVTEVILTRNANPVSLQGDELVVIAAVVIGGASIVGGRGSVMGAVLGVLLIGIVQNSLVLVGVPAVWQQVAVGVVLIIGTVVPAIRERRQKGGLV